MGNERSPEVRARHNKINPKLEDAGWNIQDYKTANVQSSKGVAVEYFQIGKDQADYILFVNGVAVGVIEAKKEGTTLIGKESQTKGYAEGFPEKYRHITLPLPFAYESNGNEVRFTNFWDPKPRSREVFNFHRPETFEEWIKHPKDTLRHRLTKIPCVENKKLRKVQEEAINNLLSSFAKDKPRALVQMATGSGKTMMAVNLCNDLIDKGKAKRILFLVDRFNLGEQTEQEFQNFEVPRDGRKFTELEYSIAESMGKDLAQATSAKVSVPTKLKEVVQIQKIPKEQKSGFEQKFPSKPVEVKYNPKFPIESFDFIIVDECHRSIYNLWKQVLDYFDAYLIGLTATPSSSTIGFFNSNLFFSDFLLLVFIINYYLNGSGSFFFSVRSGNVDIILASVVIVCLPFTSFVKGSRIAVINLVSIQINGFGSDSNKIGLFHCKGFNGGRSSEH